MIAGISVLNSLPPSPLFMQWFEIRNIDRLLVAQITPFSNASGHSEVYMINKTHENGN